jgi:6-phosphogluconate dehydrogenase (decarboxylating)
VTELVRAADPFAAAAGRVADAVQQIAAARGRVRLALPGGSAARVGGLVAELLAQRGFAFERLLLTWVDERCVPPSSELSNQGATRFTPPPGLVLPLYEEGEAPRAAVVRVTGVLAESFGSALDVVVLGLGPDGHVASLFPGRAPPRGLVAHVADSPKPPPDRITLTREMLRTARHTFVVAAGEAKRAALTRLCAGDPELPASGLPGLVVCTDLALEPPTPLAELAVVGLGVMGANLARNFARRGRRVAGFDLSADAGRRLAAEHPEAGLAVAPSWAHLVRGLERPRRLFLMVPAGDPVDRALDALAPLLEPGDVVVDAGNSHFADTERRIRRAAEGAWRFVGMGVSGGAEGALNGPALMPGGDAEAWARLRPVLEEIAARSRFGPCVTHCGAGSAGHFVKMVHNGIEYGDMQLIAEAVTLLRAGLGLTGREAADVFEEWNQGELDSFLVAITADVLRTSDPEDESGERLLVDSILDQAGQKGTGAWTVRAALELGVAIPTIAAAVDARVLSSQKARRVQAAQQFGELPRGSFAGATADDVQQALYAAKITSYSQGFELLAAADRAHGYGVDAAEIARIWTAGCIIRARLLERILEAFRSEPAPPLLAFAFARELKQRLPAWRRVVAAAVHAGLSVPALSASLAWFDTLVTARGSASLIQAQRDYFGSHGYERVDRPGQKLHTEWRAGN